MSNFMLPLSQEQQDFLRKKLQSELERTRVEYRRTATVSFRDVVKHEEQMILDILQKLKENQPV